MKLKRTSETIFLVALGGIFLALFWEWGARQTTVEYLFQRWSGYAAFTWKAVILLGIIAAVCWLIGYRQQALRRQARRRADRRAAQERHERFKDNTRIRWSAETGIPQYK